VKRTWKDKSTSGRGTKDASGKSQTWRNRGDPHRKTDEKGECREDRVGRERGKKEKWCDRKDAEDGSVQPGDL